MLLGLLLYILGLLLSLLCLLLYLLGPLLCLLLGDLEGCLGLVEVRGGAEGGGLEGLDLGGELSRGVRDGERGWRQDEVRGGAEEGCGGQRFGGTRPRRRAEQGEQGEKGGGKDLDR